MENKELENILEALDALRYYASRDSVIAETYIRRLERIVNA